MPPASVAASCGAEILGVGVDKRTWPVYVLVCQASPIGPGRGKTIVMAHRIGLVLLVAAWSASAGCVGPAPPFWVEMWPGLSLRSVLE